MKRRDPMLNVFPWTKQPESLSALLERKTTEAQITMRELIAKEMFKPSAFYVRIALRTATITRSSRGFKINIPAIA